jgi:hypothetical protein
MVFRAPFVIVGVAGLALVAALLAPTVDAQTLQIDDRGFIDTEARCEAPSSGVAFGRTQYALVAICTENGAYEYRGVRLRDDLSLVAAATETDDGAFRAENDGVTYTFSAKELVVASGDKVLVTEPMVAYVQPRPDADAS